MHNITRFLEKLGLTAFSKNINLKLNSLERSNKEYVDSKEKTISWADYQALSEAEKKNGTTYYIPDMPVSTGGEIIGKVEYGTFILSKAMVPAVDDIIPISTRLTGNIEYDNGYKLKKGKVYSINVNIGTYTGATADNAHLRYILKFNSNQLEANGISIPSSSTSNWSDTQVSFIYTPSEDGTLTINCLSIENISGLLESLTNVSIVEIPSITAQIDVTDEHIKEVSQEVYSTDETVIGKWIDGKPIYRKVITTNSTKIDVSSFNIESISDVRYFVKTTGNYIFPGAYCYSSNNMVALYFVNGYSEMSIGFVRPDTFSSATIILEYTKTTD